MFSAANSTTKVIIAGFLWIWGMYYNYKSHGCVQMAGFMLVSGSNILNIIHGVIMMSLNYKLGLKKIPNLPSNWYIRRPRAEWGKEKLVVWMDIIGMGTRVLYLFSVIYVINGWETHKKEMWVKRVIGICVCFLAAIGYGIIYHAARDDLVLRSIMPQMSIFVVYVVTIMITGIATSNITKLSSHFRKKYSKDKKIHQEPYRGKYVGLLAQIKSLRITCVWLLIGLGMECCSMGLLLLDVVTKSNFLVFTGGLGLDIVETLETIGWTISVVAIYILCSDRGH